MVKIHSQPQIVTIGGGTGAPTIIRSLVTAGYNKITAICASTDSGGRSGQIRTDERDRVISIGDLYNSVLALVSQTDSSEKHVQEFFESLAFTNGRNRKAAYDWFYSQLEALDSNYDSVQTRIESILKIKLHGRALPATNCTTHLWFETHSGRRHKGERELDEQQMSKDMVVNVWIEPQVPALETSLQAIEKADYLIYCPGSLYGSLVTNFFPQGTAQALKKSPARKILIPNLVSDRNQTHEFDLVKYMQILSKYTNLDKPYDIAIIPNISRSKFEKQYPEIAAKYDDEHAHFLDFHPDAKQITQLNIQTFPENVFLITPEGRIRHDPTTLAKLWPKIIK